MCFPSKKQKNNFADETNKDSKSKSAGNGEKAPATETTKGTETGTAQDTIQQPASSTAPTSSEPPILPPVAKTDTITTEMAAPKVAIIIYTMYGHIAKGMQFPLLVNRPIDWTPG